MKMNKKYYNAINTTPIEVQETSHGKIEVHSLNKYKQLHDTYVPKGRFVTWVSDGKGPYKLLIEDEFAEVMGDLYTAPVNERWLDFYECLEKARNKANLTILLPVSISLILSVALVQYVLPIDDSIKLYISLAVIVGFFFLNKVVNKSINQKADDLRQTAITSIKGVVGEEKFEKLLDTQEEWKKEYFKKQYEAMYGEDSYEEHLPTEGDNQPGLDVDSSDADSE